MIRRLPILSAAFLAGCGGGGGLLATVPPPVEFATLPMGVNDVPKPGVHPGELTVEHVVLAPRADGGYDSAVTPVAATTSAEAEIGEVGAVVLRRAGERQALFLGNLIAEKGVNPRTYAKLRAFDGNAEVFTYTYLKDPFGLNIVARTRPTREGTSYAFDRYTFSFGP